MKLNAYQTTAGSRLYSSKLVHEVSVELTDRDSVSYTYGINNQNQNHVIGLRFINNLAQNCPFFLHPLSIDKNDDLVIDSRAWAKYDPIERYLKITDIRECDFQIMRGILEYKSHINKSVDELLSIGAAFSVGCFTRWLGGSIKRKLMLNDQEALVVDTIIALYFQYLHKDGFRYSTADELVKGRILKTITRNTPMVNLSVVEIIAADFDKVVDEVGDVNAYTLAHGIKTCSKSVKLEHFTVGVLFSIINRSWFGNNAAELVTIAIEHLPTWYALMHSAMTENLYRKTFLAESIHYENQRNRDGDAWLNRFNDYIKDSLPKSI